MSQQFFGSVGVTCQATCIECGDEYGPHHICTDCLTSLDAAAYTRGFNDHARTVEHGQDTHSAYRQHGEGENP
jgi:ribosomal protein L32